MFDASLRVGWPQGQHSGDSASNAEGFRICGGVELEDGFIRYTGVLIFEGLLGREIRFAVTNRVEFLLWGKFIEKGLLHLRGLIGKFG